MTYRWGIASTGGIAGSFARALGAVPDAELAAVGSRTVASAARFAHEFGAARAHGSIEDLAADPEVDIVYVAGIHPVHRAHAVMMMAVGKHVLVEKPLAMDPHEVEDMIATSRRTGRFLMEAMWMRFNPLHLELKRRIDSGEFGAIRSIESDFSFLVPFDPGHRLFDPDKGGGAVLDVGIYPLTLVCWLLGRPSSVDATGRRGATGVDVEASVDLGWADGVHAHVTCGIDRVGPMTSVIRCEFAEIVIPSPSHAVDRAEIRRRLDGHDVVESLECAPASLHHQVHEVHASVAGGLRESRGMPHDESLAMAILMEDVLRRIL